MSEVSGAIAIGWPADFQVPLTPVKRARSCRAIVVRPGGVARVVSPAMKNSDHPIRIGEGEHVFLSWQPQDGCRLIPLDDAS